MHTASSMLHYSKVVLEELVKNQKLFPLGRKATTSCASYEDGALNNVVNYDNGYGTKIGAKYNF